MLVFLVLMVSVVVTTAARDSQSQRTLQGNGGLSISANDTKLETLESSNQQIGIRRSVHEPYEPCFKHFFVNNQPPSGFRQDLTTIRYICQQVPLHHETFYATMFDQFHGIAVYSAYFITPQNANNFGAVPRQGSWRAEPGITLQGTNQLYAGQAGFDKGHLVAAETLSFTREQMDSTFQYTNAVPQYQGFNRGQWSQYERRIRHYATAVCGPAGGNLYLLTGTSWAHLQAQGGPVIQGVVNPFPNIFPLNLNIVRPNSMWTAGCCVTAANAVQGAFAVIGNNVAINNMIFMSKVTVAQLQIFLRIGVAGFGGQTIDLFPGNQACSALANDVTALPLPPPGR